MTDDGHPQSMPLAVQLTAREQEILALVANQRTNRQIAAELHLAHSTIRWYLRQIYAKLGVSGRKMAVVRAQALGLVAKSTSLRMQGSVLPAEATPFVGRQVEMQALGELLIDGRTRLITILGPGGIGKTRLALKLAAQQEGRLWPGTDRKTFPNGIWYAPLVSIEAATNVAPALAGVLDLQLEPPSHALRSPERQVIDYLRRKQLLLVLDNFEHLLDAAAFLALLLREAPQIKMLVTSRERLQLQGEHLFWLQGLEVPDAGAVAGVARNAAVRLFANTTRRMNQSFHVKHANVEAIGRICRLLDGLPLAIELAASWTNALPLATIEEQVRQGLDILASELRDMPPRHRSMQAALDVSWQRLSTMEKDIFRRLTVFRGGFTQDAAMQVAGADLPELGALINTCWLGFDLSQERYQIHELLRQFGENKLREDPAHEQQARERHARFYCRVLYDREPAWSGAEAAEVMTEVEGEMGNVRQAWKWAIMHSEVRLISQGLHSLCALYDRRGYDEEARESLRLADDVLSSSLGTTTTDDDIQQRRLRARLLTWLARFSVSVEEGLARLDQGAELLSDLRQQGIDVRRDEAFLATQMGETALRVNPLVARPHLKWALSLYGNLQDPAGEAQATTALGIVSWHVGDYEQAAELVQRGLEKQRALGNAGGIAQALGPLGLIEKHRGRLQEARRAHRESYALFRRLGNRFDAAQLAGTLSNTLIWSGLFAEAKEVALRGLQRGEEMASTAVMGYTADAATSACINLGDYEQAHRHSDRALALTRATGDRQTQGWSSMFRGQLSLVSITHEEAIGWFRQGRSLLAKYRKSIWMMPLTFEALALHRTGQPEPARRALGEALRENMSTHVFFVVVNALPAAALLVAEQGDLQRALELHALACRYPYVANSRWFEDIMAQDVALWSEALPADVVAGARARGRALDLWETAEALVAAFDDPL